MYMKRLQIVVCCTIAVVMFALGWYSRGRQIPDAGEVVVRVDTVYYERPQFTASSSRTVTVNVPRVLFAGERVNDSCKSFTYNSTNVKETAEVVAYSATTDYGKQCANNAQCPFSCSEIPDNSIPTPERPDSVQMQVEVETRIYEDSLYRAQVSGPAVGELHPSLDWIELYARTTTQTHTRRQRFALTAGVGAAYTPRGFQPTVGVQFGVILWGF